MLYHSKRVSQDTNCTTIRDITKEEQSFDSEKANLDSFKKYLEQCLSVFQYDTAKLMSEGYLPPNNDIPEDN